MSIHFLTANPKKLLNEFKGAIDSGRVVTWSCDADGDFTHTATQWKSLAWLRPKIISETELILIILPPKNRTISSEVYAIYHGRFIEAMLRHCDKLFSKAFATALAADGDRIG